MVFSSLLTFAQKRSNAMLEKLVVISFWIQAIIGILVWWYLPMDDPYIRYLFATSHPLSRLPIFFMGICAGLLAIRLQNGDLEALQSE